MQKGPYINGTEITMYELNGSLDQTGKSSNAKISDNKGSFQINNVALSSNLVEFSASGFYFDEVKGDISASQLNLTALSDINVSSSVNVNLLTHLERRRVLPKTMWGCLSGRKFSSERRTDRADLAGRAAFGKEG